MNKILYLILTLLLLGSCCLGAACIMMLIDVLNNGTPSLQSAAVGFVGLTILLISLYFYNRNKKINEMPDAIPVPMLGAFCLGISCKMLIADIGDGTVSPGSIIAGTMGLVFLVIGLYVYYRDRKE